MIGERGALLVREIDIVLNNLNEALLRAQPPYSGRLTIKFVDEGSEELTPIIQKLQITRGGKFFPVRVPSTRLSTRAASKSSFSINHEYVKSLLNHAQYLIETRKTINIKVRQMKHWESLFCKSHEGKVIESRQAISDLHVSVEDNLRGRKTRSAKNAEREQSGLVTVVMENKYSAKKPQKRSVAPKRKDVFIENKEEQIT